MKETIAIVFLLLTVAGGGLIFFTKNVVHAVYALALCVVGIATLYVLLHAELLAVVQILIYGGGIVILMAFGVMMSLRPRNHQLLSSSRNKIIAGIISIAIFVLLCWIMEYLPSGIENSEINQIRAIGISFLLDHLVAFELISFVLLVTLVGATYLAKMADGSTQV